ncbi:hypothetical protein FCM35_KLT16706 [Carex littledalei]|uniref:Uncharacterized protein n=1 Tax=Carex littledalei TaxID=544730 RepID=A0A833R6R7_9POAL|nr:hypothetical protein FCM35_KLT16706 [Carex littledalei]
MATSPHTREAHITSITLAFATVAISATAVFLSRFFYRRRCKGLEDREYIFKITFWEDCNGGLCENFYTAISQEAQLIIEIKSSCSVKGLFLSEEGKERNGKGREETEELGSKVDVSLSPPFPSSPSTSATPTREHILILS